MTGRTTTSTSSQRNPRQGTAGFVATRPARVAGAALLAGLLSTGATAQIVPVEPLYELVDLGTLGGSSSVALGMNELGDVVGWAETGSGVHAFLWQDGQMADLGTLGGRFSEARDVNDFMQIVGVASDANEQPRAFYAWNGMFFDLNDLLVRPIPPMPREPDNGDFSPELLEANAINDTGAIVAVGGNGQDDFVRTYLLRPVSSFDPYRPRFTYTETEFVPAAVPSQNQLRSAAISDQGVDQSGQSASGPSVTVGLGLNDFDQVVGVSMEQAFLWLNDGLDGLLDIGHTSQANALSDWGLIVGWTAGPAGRPRASLWSMWLPDQVWSLYTSPGWSSEALDVNSNGAAVGWTADNPQGNDAVAMVWTGTAAWNLNDRTALPEGPAFWETLEEATAIDDQQRIAGYGRLTDLGLRAFILLPIEPDPID
jgi:probable HAF family extracellular repeat protein